MGPDRAKVAAKLKRTKNANTIIGPVEFDDHGQNTVPLISKYVSQDGKWVLWEDSSTPPGSGPCPGSGSRSSSDVPRAPCRQSSSSSSRR